jgi:hypothetical protein
VKKLRSNWEEQITHALEEGRVLQALRFSAQPPEPTARFPAALVDRLATAAGTAMTQTTPAERWLALLDAAVVSPIRRQIHPAGLPEDSTGEVVRRARLACGSVPSLAPMVGLSMPPPPKPVPGAHPSRPPRPSPRPPRRPPKPSGMPKPIEASATSAETAAGDAANHEEPPAGSGAAQSEDSPASPVGLDDTPLVPIDAGSDAPAEDSAPEPSTDEGSPATEDPLEASGAARTEDSPASAVELYDTPLVPIDASSDAPAEDSGPEPLADEGSSATEESPSAGPADS